MGLGLTGSENLFITLNYGMDMYERTAPDS